MAARSPQPTWPSRTRSSTTTCSTVRSRYWGGQEVELLPPASLDGPAPDSTGTERRSCGSPGTRIAWSRSGSPAARSCHRRSASPPAGRPTSRSTGSAGRSCPYVSNGGGRGGRCGWTAIHERPPGPRAGGREVVTRGPPFRTGRRSPFPAAPPVLILHRPPPDPPAAVGPRGVAKRSRASHPPDQARRTSMSHISAGRAHHLGAGAGCGSSSSRATRPGGRAGAPGRTGAAGG